MTWEADQVQSMRGRSPPVGWQIVADAVGGYIEDVRNRYDSARREFIQDTSGKGAPTALKKWDGGSSSLQRDGRPAKSLALLGMVEVLTTTEIATALHSSRTRARSALARLDVLGLVRGRSGAMDSSWSITEDGQQALREMRG